jgi:hypothetical protein
LTNVWFFTAPPAFTEKKVLIHFAKRKWFFLLLLLFTIILPLLHRCIYPFLFNFFPIIFPFFIFFNFFCRFLFPCNWIIDAVSTSEVRVCWIPGVKHAPAKTHNCRLSSINSSHGSFIPRGRNCYKMLCT